jgi:hypothetical protein
MELVSRGTDAIRRPASPIAGQFRLFPAIFGVQDARRGWCLQHGTVARNRTLWRNPDLAFRRRPAFRPH